jgi:PPM family protein phosphatase
VLLLMLDAFGLSDPGCVRGNNEDAYLLDRALDLYLVADGMGGAQAGEHASRIAVDTVARECSAAPAASAEVLVRAFEQANRRVLSAANNDPNLFGMGTTLTAAWRIDEEMLVANVGDSRAYVFIEGQLHIITDDQTWINEVGRKKLGIGETILKTHPMRHVLTMAIGVGDILRVQSYAIPLVRDAQFLLCSDGLHGVVSPRVIAEILATERNLEEKSHSLVDAARKAGGPDNITVVLVRAAS